MTTDLDYYQIPRISNSDLSRFKCEVVLGKPYVFPPLAGLFGGELHKMVLEPHLCLERHPQLNYDLLEPMAERVQKDPVCAALLKDSLKEHVLLFEEAETATPCKCKLDLIQYGSNAKPRIIMDLKSTSTRTEAQFLEATREYDYDRQAAFYLEATGAETFLFVGVQKAKPFRLFHYEITRYPDTVELGRKKYKALLKGYLKYYNQQAMQVENELKVSQAQAQKKLIQAEAEAKTNQLRQQTLTPMLIQQQFIEKWDGNTPIYGNTPVFKNMD